MHYRTGNPVWERLSTFWTKVFALAFGMGVVSGIVMAFQFGTNWSAFSYASANFMEPILSCEVVTAFFLEAPFLGVLLFGRNKVPRGVHLFSACMVAIGSFISFFWIHSANSWMQTPGGELRGIALARLMLTDPRIVILDETTTGLDQDTARTVCDTLEQWLGERSAVMISHDPGLLPRFDRVCSMAL